ncbi:MAG TPA: 50S ribosomal protein L25 [Kiritimatiellia bacterium]|nr:50S ribosomal protein L25 [Kiritimatiellia bacterium]HRU70995.1 50S ribosomal protein L25 [Kiritimatiellia bacterium]
MANEQIKLKAEPRTEQGSVAVGRLRRAGNIPAAVNRIGGGTTLVKLNTHAFVIMLRHHASEQMLVTLDLDGQEIPALMREVQYDVMTGRPIHADFGEVSLSKKIRVSIPLLLVGEPEGVKIGGGILQQMLRSVEVECLPTEIVESFGVDVAALKLGQSMFARDLKLGDAYTVITGKDSVIATVAAPEEDAAGAAAGTAAAAPEVITKGKKEEGAEDAAPAAKK